MAEMWGDVQPTKYLAAPAPKINLGNQPAFMPILDKATGWTTQTVTVYNPATVVAHGLPSDIFKDFDLILRAYRYRYGGSGNTQRTASDSGWKGLTTWDGTFDVYEGSNDLGGRPNPAGALQRLGTLPVTSHEQVLDVQPMVGGWVCMAPAEYLGATNLSNTVQLLQSTYRLRQNWRASDKTGRAGSFRPIRFRFAYWCKPKGAPITDWFQCSAMSEQIVLRPKVRPIRRSSVLTSRWEPQPGYDSTQVYWLLGEGKP